MFVDSISYAGRVRNGFSRMGRSYVVRFCICLAVVPIGLQWRLDIPHAKQAALRRAVDLLMVSSVQMQSPRSLRQVSKSAEACVKCVFRWRCSKYATSRRAIGDIDRDGRVDAREIFEMGR
jgi:hypothetical protein